MAAFVCSGRSRPKVRIGGEVEAGHEQHGRDQDADEHRDHRPDDGGEEEEARGPVVVADGVACRARRLRRDALPPGGQRRTVLLIGLPSCLGAAADGAVRRGDRDASGGRRIAHGDALGPPRPPRRAHERDLGSRPSSRDGTPARDSRPPGISRRCGAVQRVATTQVSTSFGAHCTRRCIGQSARMSMVGTSPSAMRRGICALRVEWAVCAYGRPLFVHVRHRAPRIANWSSAGRGQAVGSASGSML